MYIPWLKKRVDSALDVIWLILSRNKKQGNSSVSSKWKFSSFMRSNRSPKAPTIIKTESSSPFWALIIGINAYEYPKLMKLSGAVSDADAMRKYLESELKVPPNQIVNLRDGQATRNAIISALEGLRDNPNIKPQDPIMIYYAGHGGEIPSEDPDKTQTLIPVDYKPDKIPPIPDHTLAVLIDGIAKRHGNNITVIFDCCHSGSGTRGTEVTVRAANLRKEDFYAGIDARITQDARLEGTRSMHHAKGFAQKGMNSHILLAACSAKELAREDKHGGRFTAALLELFNSIPLNQLTYADVLSKMPRIDGQNPQCEGHFKNRILFDSKVHPQAIRCYEVRIDEKIYTLEGGRAHGITEGAEFTLYEKKEDVPRKPLCVMVSKEHKIGPFSTTLDIVGDPPAGLAGSAIAIQTRAGESEDLKLHVPLETKFIPVFEAIAREMEETTINPRRIKLVERDEAKIGVVAVGEKLAFDVLEKRATDYGFTRIPHDVDIDVDDIHHILRGAAHYHYHLNINQENNQIQAQIKIEFFPLKEVFDRTINDTVYMPNGGSLYDEKRAVIDYEVEEGTKYGMKLVNKTPWDLHFACFFFDHADFSISALSEYKKQTDYSQDYSLQKDATVEIGYGGSRIPPFDCDIPEGLDVTVGFLKFYFTSEFVDLSHVPQDSPFERNRGMKPSQKREGSVWGTVLIPVIQRRKLP